MHGHGWQQAAHDAELCGTRLCSAGLSGTQLLLCATGLCRPGLSGLSGALSLSLLLRLLPRTVLLPPAILFGAWPKLLFQLGRRWRLSPSSSSLISYRSRSVRRDSRRIALVQKIDKGPQDRRHLPGSGIRETGKARRPIDKHAFQPAIGKPDCALKIQAIGDAHAIEGRMQGKLSIIRDQRPPAQQR